MQVRDYCSKTDTRMDGHKVFEYGEFVKNGERSDLNDITQMIESGATDRDIQLAYPSHFFRYYKNIAQLRQVYLETKFNNVFRELQITIYAAQPKRQNALRYGQVRLYKRISGYDLRPTAFDSYNGQDVIAFEEFRSSFKIEDMLKYLEGYPLMLPSRYNNKVACYTKVYIITN